MMLTDWKRLAKNEWITSAGVSTRFGSGLFARGLDLRWEFGTRYGEHRDNTAKNFVTIAARARSYYFQRVAHPIQVKPNI